MGRPCRQVASLPAVSSLIFSRPCSLGSIQELHQKVRGGGAIPYKNCNTGISTIFLSFLGLQDDGRRRERRRVSVTRQEKSGKKINVTKGHSNIAIGKTLQKGIDITTINPKM